MGGVESTGGGCCGGDRGKVYSKERINAGDPLEPEVLRALPASVQQVVANIERVEMMLNTLSQEELVQRCGEAHKLLADSIQPLQKNRAEYPVLQRTVAKYNALAKYMASDVAKLVQSFHATQLQSQCAACKIKFTSTDVVRDAGLLRFHAACFACPVCNTPIMGDYVKADDSNTFYHRACDPQERSQKNRENIKDLLKTVAATRATDSTKIQADDDALTRALKKKKNEMTDNVTESEQPGASAAGDTSSSKSTAAVAAVAAASGAAVGAAVAAAASSNKSGGKAALPASATAPAALGDSAGKGKGKGKDDEESESSESESGSDDGSSSDGDGTSSSESGSGSGSSETEEDSPRDKKAPARNK